MAPPLGAICMLKMAGKSSNDAPHFNLPKFGVKPANHESRPSLVVPVLPAMSGRRSDSAALAVPSRTTPCRTACCACRACRLTTSRQGLLGLDGRVLGDRLTSIGRPRPLLRARRRAHSAPWRLVVVCAGHASTISGGGGPLFPFPFNDILSSTRERVSEIQVFGYATREQVQALWRHRAASLEAEERAARKRAANDVRKFSAEKEREERHAGR